MLKVAVNGYGTIGRRVADAIELQSDMELAGITKWTPDYYAFLASNKGIPIYAGDEQSKQKLLAAGVKVSGLMSDLLSYSEIVVDCSPEKGEQNKKLYLDSGKKAVFQGGEEPSIAECSFVAQCNFDEASNRRYVRVVSCNTTGLCRVLKTIDDSVGIEKAIATLVRRATDPNDSKKGPIDSVVPDPVELPSHHSMDVKTVLHGINLTTMAVKVPTTHMHLHALAVKVRDPDLSKVQEGFSKATRVLLVNSRHGHNSTSTIMDYARELGRPRGDLYEAAVWKESMKIEDGWLYLYMGIHQEAIVVPENIDCIRSMAGMMDAGSSIQATNRSLGIIK
jgi:glyceraldehyde-3-phosphate dehydrogenase (NAD(P))